MRQTGIEVVGDVPWGTHFCQFYESPEDLIDLLVPYFRHGLLANEYCMWITSEPLVQRQAKAALQAIIPDLEARIAGGQIDFLSYDQWYTRSGRFDKDMVLQGWVERLAYALRSGYEGLRLSGNTFWLEKTDWLPFAEYEEAINRVIGQCKMVALCTYSLQKCGAAEIADVISNHQFALIRRAGRWVSIESSFSRRMSEDFQRAQAVAQTGSWRLDLHRNELVWSEENHRIFGIPAGTPLTYESFLRAVHPEDRKSVIREWEAALRGKRYDVEHRIVVGGRVKWVRERAEVERDQGGQVVGAFGTSQDITERKQGELERERLLRALRRGVRRFELLSRTAGELLQSSDPQKAVDSLCRKVMKQLDCHAFFNYLIDERERRLRMNACTGIPPEEAKRIQWLDYGVAVCGCVARDGCRIVAEHIPTTPDPRTDLVRSFGIKAYACHPLLGRGGTVIGTLSFGTRSRETFSADDLSLMQAVTDQVALAMERMRNEQALKQAHDELEERVLMRTGELQQRAMQLARLASELTLVEQRERRRLAQVLHDHLQQLLVGAKFGLELVSRRNNGDQKSAVEQVAKMIDESINVSRSLTIELSPPILHEAGLAGGLEWLARWMLEKHGISVTVHADRSAVIGREDFLVLLFQAARELLLNVVKYAQVTAARACLVRRDDTHVELTVSDEGVGFDAEAVLSGTGPTSGGFGLFSIRERLSLLGGFFEVSSGPSRGTKVTMVVPAPSAEGARRRRHEEPGAGNAVDTKSPSVGTPTQSRGHKIRVLLVDDHVVMRQGLSRLLEVEADIEIVGEASDGEEAVGLSRQLMPDVILMDFSMPRMDGVEATSLIHAEFPGIRIVGLSMYDEVDRGEVMLAAGAAAYVSKSGEPGDLLAAIRQRMEQAPSIPRSEQKKPADRAAAAGSG